MPEWILLAFSMVLGFIGASFVAKKAAELGAGKAVQTIVAVISFFAIGMVLAGLLVAPIGYVLGLRVPPPKPVPVMPEIQNVGFVQAVVTDQYKVPKTAIQDAIVQATLSRPEPGRAIIEIASENTNADGSALLKLEGVTSGTVWVVAQKSGYYSAVGSTSVPGAQIYPVEALWVKPELAKIGTLSLNVTNLSSGATWDSATKTITENLTTSKAHYFTIELTVTAAYEALRDMQISPIRGSDWENLGAAPLVVTVIDDADTTIETIGDITLSKDISAKLNARGDLTYAVILKIQIKTNVAYAFSGKELLRITINDLLGSVGYAGEAGISATEIRVRTTV